MTWQMSSPPGEAGFVLLKRKEDFMHTEYYLLTVDVTVQGPVTLTASTQGRRKERLEPKQNPSQFETGFSIVRGGKKVWQKKRKIR